MVARPSRVPATTRFSSLKFNMLTLLQGPGRKIRQPKEKLGIKEILQYYGHFKLFNLRADVH
jgi:hypothetical protein